jgi:hypothetical protein
MWKHSKRKPNREILNGIRFDFLLKLEKIENSEHTPFWFYFLILIQKAGASDSSIRNFGSLALTQTYLDKFSTFFQYFFLVFQVFLKKIPELLFTQGIFIQNYSSVVFT